MAVKKERLTMVGLKTLSAPLLHEDIIKEGDTLELSGAALDWANTKTRTDPLGNVHNVFYPEGSPQAKRARGEKVAVPAAQTGRRRRRV